MTWYVCLAEKCRFLAGVLFVGSAVALSSCAFTVRTDPVVTKNTTVTVGVLPWSVQGTVHATVVHNDVIYVGGDFMEAGALTGNGVFLETAATGAVSAIAKGGVDFTQRVNGIIYAAAPDGTGGFYIGGAF